MVDKETAYRIYVTDALKAIIHADTRYFDCISNKPKAKEERSQDEVVTDIMKKGGLKF